jgi:hypothetical protein
VHAWDLCVLSCDSCDEPNSHLLLLFFLGTEAPGSASVRVGQMESACAAGVLVISVNGKLQEHSYTSIFGIYIASSTHATMCGIGCVRGAHDYVSHL